jgi:hypothetical protein
MSTQPIYKVVCPAGTCQHVEMDLSNAVRMRDQLARRAKLKAFIELNKADIMEKLLENGQYEHTLGHFIESHYTVPFQVFDGPVYSVETVRV